MINVKCIGTMRPDLFIDGKTYQAGDNLDFVIGEDMDSENPFKLRELKAIGFGSFVASFGVEG